MGLPAKLLAEGERPLVVLRPHVRRLVRPALLLLVLAPVASFAVAAVPRGAAQLPVRLLVAALAVLTALRWVVVPFALWWNTIYVLTDERLLERQGVVRRSGHDLPLRGVTDVVVAQKLRERLLRCGTLSVTTDGGGELVVTDVPAVHRVQRSLLAVADDIGERLRAAQEERWRSESAVEPDDITPDGPDGDGWNNVPWDDEPSDVEPWGAWDDEPAPESEGPSRRETRRRGRESARRLKALQTEVGRAPRVDSPLEDDGLEPAQAAPTPSPMAGDVSDEADDGGDNTEGARILRFPHRP